VPQSYSLKAADPEKLESYFVYLSKGVRSEHGGDVRVLYEPHARLWPELHEKYHAKAGEIAARKKGKGVSGDFYVSLAEKCTTLGKTSKEDVLGVVVGYYVDDAKKGFDQFAVMRTFHAVYARVNGEECRAWLFDACSNRLFKW